MHVLVLLVGLLRAARVFVHCAHSGVRVEIPWLGLEEESRRARGVVDDTSMMPVFARRGGRPQSCFLGGGEAGRARASIQSKQNDTIQFERWACMSRQECRFGLASDAELESAEDETGRPLLDVVDVVVACVVSPTTLPLA